MRINRWQSTRQYHWVGILLILTLLLGSFPVQLILATTSNDSIQKNGKTHPLSKITGFNEVPRLTGKITPIPDADTSFNTDSTESQLNNHSTANFAIGSQSGTGGGTITIRDSFNWTGTEAMNTTNQYNASEIPSIRTDSITITNSTGFNRNEAYFNITDVVAESDKRAIEEFGDPLLPYSTSRASGGITNWHFEMAMSFTIQDDYANLTKVRTYTDGFGSATGQIYIVNSTSGAPDDSLLLSSKENLASSGLDPSWHEYTFDSPVLLRSGITYYVVMNETNSDDVNNFWFWPYVQDGRDDGKVYYKYNTHGPTQWTNQPGQDLPLDIEVLPVEHNGTAYVAKTYSIPTDIGFSYNTSVDNTELSSFWFPWNGTETHTFQTSSSVSFNLEFIANYTATANPLTGSTSYLVQNATSSQWNVSFSTSSVNTTFSVTDRTMVVQGLANDWDGSAIFHGSSLVYNTSASGGLNGSIAYITNSEIMTIHASKLTTAETWAISFTALNYLLDFSLSRGGSSLTFPYQANVTDVLDLEFNVQTAGNTSYWIDYPDGTQVQKGTDINSTHINFSKEWNINSSVDQTTNINGTYGLQAFWINADKTKVGTFTRQLAVYVNTSLSVTAEGEVIRGELFKVSSIYRSIHNNSGIRDVTIWCNTSWTTNTTMTPLFNGSYTVSLGDTLNEGPGYIGTVVITTQVDWFVNWIEIITVKFVDNSSISVNNTNIGVEWRENTTIKIDYLNSIGGPITDGVVQIGGNNAVYITDAYYYRMNSTDYGSDGFYPNILVNATHSNYLSQISYIDLLITPGITSIRSSPFANDSNQNIAYANSSADVVSFNLQYYHNLTNDNLSTSAPTIESLLPVVSSPGVENSWIIDLNPNQSGVFIFNITFNLGNYNPAFFTFSLTVQEAQTRIQTNFLNDTQVYYAESYAFSVFYSNIDWIENITFDPIISVTLLLSNVEKVQFLNRTGDLYWFEFDYNPLAVGIGAHSVTITFQGIDYLESHSLVVIFEVIKSPYVALDGRETVSGDLLVNTTSSYSRAFSPNEYDNLTLSFSYYRNKTGQILDISMSEIVFLKDLSVANISIKELNYNWSFILDGSIIGTFLISITFSHENYSSLTFQIEYQIVQATSSITNYDSTNLDNPSPGINASEKSSNSIEFWMVWTSQYGESISDTDGVLSSNVTLLVFLNSTDILGTYYHYFRYTAAEIGIDTIDLTFGTVNYTDLIITLYFNVTDRGLVINDVLSTHPNNWPSTVGYLQYGDRYYFNVIINDSEDGSPVDITVFTGLDIYNITFVNVSNGNHLFFYEAWIIATLSSVQLSIRFTKANYASANYFINFFVKSAESTIATAPSSVNTYYSQNLNFSILWQSEVNPNAPFTPIYGINSTLISSPLPVVYTSLTNGNYTFTVIANQTGVFVLSIFFFSPFFEDQEHSITIFIAKVPTELGVTTHSNASSIPSEIYYSDSYDFTIGWLSSFNASGIQDKSPQVVVDVSGNVTFVTSFANGTHKFKIYADALGVYQISITLETANFGKLLYILDYQVSKMPTLTIFAENITLVDTIYVEESFILNGSGYQTYRGENISVIDELSIWLNGTLVNAGQIQINNASYYFELSVSTLNFAYGFYNISLLVNSSGYEPQFVNLTIVLLGRSLNVDVSLPVSTIQQGENITIDVTLTYVALINAGFGSTSMLAPWTDIIVHYYVEMDFTNGSTKVLETDINVDILGHASYLIPGSLTKSASGFSNITVFISGSSTSLPTSYSMSDEELNEIKITEFLDPLEILIPALIGLVILLFIVSSVYYVNRKRVSRSQVKRFAEITVEQGFEDIKSIRLILARHQSGLQFYSEKTIAELQTDTDALSGMSAALSSFMEELSESMSSQSEEETERDKIEFLSREGLHMLIWHGYHSSLIIISEVRLPDYFQTNLKALGHELEDKYLTELQDFYSSDQIPNTVVKKMVRRYIPLHYFSAYVLNEGVLTLDSVKLSRKYVKMFKEIKKVMFNIEGAHYFFSEQIISHLSKDYKRSEAIKFLDHAININLLIEAEQKDLLQLTKL